MLIRLNDKWVIKTDRYQYMLCVDKGPTKFPGGIIAPLYSPNKFCSTLCSTITAKTKRDDNMVGVLDDQQIDAVYIAACEAEEELYELANHIDGDVDECEMFESHIEFHKDHYVVTLPVRNGDGSVEKLGSHHVYPPTYGSAIMDCYSFYLKEHPRFNCTDMENDSPLYWNEVCKFIEETKAIIRAL